MSTPEGRIKARLDKMLKEEGIWYFSPQAGLYGRAGIADRVLCAYGRFISVEVKSGPRAKLTKLQEKHASEIIKAHGLWFRVHDQNSINELRDYLRASSFGQKSTHC
jgi:hypothetical protein